jgi:hypothetical protein
LRKIEPVSKYGGICQSKHLPREDLLESGAPRGKAVFIAFSAGSVRDSSWSVPKPVVLREKFSETTGNDVSNSLSIIQQSSLTKLDVSKQACSLSGANQVMKMTQIAPKETRPVAVPVMRRRRKLRLNIIELLYCLIK